MSETICTYADALKKILERTDMERGPRPPYSERVWRLDHVRELLACVGNPHLAYRTAHVAGTKGKGSTTAMIDSILSAAGLKTGMYTSPHLHTFRERMRVSGQLIPEQRVIELARELDLHVASRPQITVFEVITALAMLYFFREQVDWGVFEVGLGGRLDTTNVVAPEVTVITSVSMDHMAVLGPTLRHIAREKAGIIKPGVPVVSAPQRIEALDVVASRAAELDAPLVLSGRDWCWRSLSVDGGSQRISVYRPGNRRTPEYPQVVLPLLGGHQAENAVNAIMAIEVLRTAGYAIARKAVREGLAAVSWPGRFEIMQREPTVVVDGAHNVDSMEKLVAALPSAGAYDRLHLVFGASRSHMPTDLLGVLAPIADSVHLAQANHPRATPTAELAQTMSDLGVCAQTHPDVATALAEAIKAAASTDLVLATGSLFVVAEARRAWFSLNELPLPPSDPPGVY